MMEEDYEKEVEEFLKKQCLMKGGRLMPLWNIDDHELIYIPPKEEEFHIEG